MKKLSRLAVMLALVLALTACSGGDAESIDHFTFRRSSDARIDLWELSD